MLQLLCPSQTSTYTPLPTASKLTMSWPKYKVCLHSPVSPLDNTFALPAEVFSPSSQQLWLVCFFCDRPCDMELVTRQSERSDHQQRLLQAFTEDVFIFSVHSALELSGTKHSTNLLIYLLRLVNYSRWLAADCGAVYWHN